MSDDWKLTLERKNIIQLIDDHIKCIKAHPTYKVSAIRYESHVSIIFKKII